MIDNYLSYCLFAIVVTAVPGPAVLLTIKNSVKYGFKTAIANILGNFIAMVTLATISAAGLGALILTSSKLFALMKIAGCGYLVYLGIQTFIAKEKGDAEISGPMGSSTPKTRTVFIEGLLTGISNPKAIAFFVALFPQFINPTNAYVPQFLTLILTIEGISIVILSTYALLSSVASPLLLREKSGNIFKKITGITFIGFGLALLHES